MLRHLDGVVSPWAAASPFGLDAGGCPEPEEIPVLAEAGAKWLRVDCPAQAVARPDGGWTVPPEFARGIEACHEADIQALGVLAYGESSRAGKAVALVAPPTAQQLAAYADYVGATVGRLREWTKHWELRSAAREPARRTPPPFPDAYLEVLRAGCRAAKSADPGCTLIGSVSAAGRACIERLLALGGAEHMDALLVEVDGGRAEEEFGEALEAVSRLARAQSHALSVWVAVGESGPAPAAVEGLVRLCLLGLAGGAERVFWPGFRGDGPTSLIGADLTLQPPYAAYRTMTRLLEGAECRGPMSAPHGVRAIAFAKHRQELLAFWALEGVAEVELLGTDILRWDVAGHASRIAHGPIHVAVGASPIYAVGHSLRLASR